MYTSLTHTPLPPLHLTPLPASTPPSLRPLHHHHHTTTSVTPAASTTTTTTNSTTTTASPTDTRMRSAVFAVMLLLAVCWSPAAGWGHIFSKSRFRPEAGPNWGYGGIGQHYTQGQQRMPSPREQLLEALLGGEQGLLEEQLCEGRRCTSNDQCCDDFICGAFDGASGSCVSAVSQREGAECIGDSDCGAGSFCDAGFCVLFSGKKGYNEPCTTSSECDVSRGLCCQVVRRYRQEPKTLCGYFKEPMVCFGHVAVDQVKDGGALKH